MKKLIKTLKRIFLGVKPYYLMKDGGVYASDVDDTLIMWSVPQDYRGPIVTTNYGGFKDRGIPNLEAVKHLKKMKARGYSVVVWSAGGSDWAEVAVKALGIEDWVDVVMPKIDFHLDDVECPTDKIGKWQYITPDGKMFKMKDGEVVQRTTGHKFQTYEEENESNEN
jgi:hypothetical protein